jgi:L-alanine-DL-glutamate epimerase-like enolase superfamily enzyme
MLPSVLSCPFYGVSPRAVQAGAHRFHSGEQLAQACYVAIVDCLPDAATFIAHVITGGPVAWNGILESAKIAAMADAYEVTVAPHNFNGHLGSLMSAHLCAAIPNFRVMEIDIEDVPWKDDLVSKPPVIEAGELLIPTGPGWGVEINEDVIRAHPPARPVKWTK